MPKAEVHLFANYSSRVVIDLFVFCLLVGFFESDDVKMGEILGESV